MNTLEMPTERCAELAEGFGIQTINTPFIDNGKLNYTDAYYLDGREGLVFKEDFNPTNADAYFLLKRAVEKIDEVRSTEICFQKFEEGRFIHAAIIKLKDKKYKACASEDPKEAFFLAAYELMKRLQREQEG